MKTIEERAKEYAKTEYEQFGAFPEIVARESYAKGATEQKAIDDAILLKLKSAWEKEAQINHDDEANRKQGYHDAIEEAYKWIKANTEGGVHPQNAYGFADRFLKEMEK
mgnify:FL=1